MAGERHYTKRLPHVRAEPSLVAELQAIANDSGRSMASVIREVLRKEITRANRQKRSKL